MKQTVRMTLYAFPDETFNGTVTRIYDQADPDRRTFEVEVSFEKLEQRFQPGMTGELAFVMAEKPVAMIVPAQALLFRSSGMQVALVGPDNRIHLQDVTLGRNLGSEVEIRSGLTQSDRFVANPSLGLLEGQRVKIVQPVKGYQPTQRGPPPRPTASPSRPATSSPFSANAAKERAAATEPGSGTPP